MEKTTIRSLINRLDMYVTGVFSFLNKKTKIQFNNKFVCFDIGNLPKQVKPVIMFLVLDYVYMKMKANLDRKILLIDESWALLSRTEDAGYIFEIVKTCRKFNMGLLLINQEVEGLFTTAAGKSVLANSAYTLLMRQKPAVIDNICSTFNLSPSERSHLLTASVGEGLLIMEDDHSKIKVIASPEEHEVITTNSEEVKEKVKPACKPSTDEINIDESKEFYKVRNLNDEEIKMLKDKGFKEIFQKSFITGKKENYLILERPNESSVHTFLVLEIKDFLERKGIKVKTFETRKADLVCEINGKEYALEIETGSTLRVKNRINEKIDLLNSEGFEDWFFIVTDRNLVKKYRKYGKTIDPRWVANFLKKMLKNRNSRLGRNGGWKGKNRRQKRKK